jgi:two-component system invasion response regulator UvrY
MHELRMVSPVHPVPLIREGRIKTVIVDDSAHYLEALWSLLELENLVEIIGTGMSGLDAVSAVAELDPDLILMDVNMQPMSGPAAAMVISAMYPRTKLILMSAEDSPQLRAECFACGAHSFVSKANFMKEFPIAIDQLGLRGGRPTAH